MEKEKLYLAAAVAAMPAAAQAQQGKATPERPNIIFILADDMGYGDLSCFGSRYVKTPNIDRLAQTGTAFTQCYAGSGISSPSRCALMTGKNTGNTRIRDNTCTAGGLRGIKINPAGDTTYIRRAHLLPEDTTIATVLRTAGYKTCLVNKWHLDGYNPQAAPHYRGFDEFHGWTISTVHSNSPYYYPYYRFDGDSLIHIDENARDQRVKHNTDLSTDDAIGFISRNRQQPFFLYLAFDAPHEPYIIEQQTWDMEKLEREVLDTAGKEQGGANRQALQANRNTVVRYAALIEHMDAAIGRLMAYLDEHGLRQNTLVVFASDNGAAVQAPIAELNCNAGLHGRKGQLYEGGIRVPMIVNQPGKVVAQRLQNIVYFPDVMPTFAALTGSEKALPQQLNGINILPLFYGRAVDTDNRLLYWEFPGKQRAARRGDWKCVTVKPGQPLELYNLKDDPEERYNLAGRYPELVKQMDEEMKQMRRPSANWPLPGEVF